MVLLMRQACVELNCRVAKMAFNFTGVKIFMCLAVLLATTGGISDSNARVIYRPIEKPITDAQYTRFENILNCLGNVFNLESLTTDCSKGKVARKNIKAHTTKAYSIIRIEDEAYCVEELCLGYVVMNCNLDFCPRASAMIADRFFVPDNLGSWDREQKLGQTFALVFDGGGRKETVFLLGLTGGFVTVLVSNGMPRR